MKLLKLSKDKLNELYSRARDQRNNPTAAELQGWVLLRKLQPTYIFRRQIVPYGTAFIVDFFCQKLNLAIEIDGSCHDSFDAQQKDEARTNMLNRWGIRVMRFTNQTVLEEPEFVFRQIAKMCDILEKKYYGHAKHILIPTDSRSLGIRRINQLKREGRQNLRARLF